jgi:hypothetical protein
MIGGSGDQILQVVNSVCTLHQVVLNRVFDTKDLLSHIIFR